MKHVRIYFESGAISICPFTCTIAEALEAAAEMTRIAESCGAKVLKVTIE